MCVDTHVSDFIVGTLTDLWEGLWKQMQGWKKNTECWLGRISIILTLMKWFQGRCLFLGKVKSCLSTQNLRQMPETGIFSVLTGAKAQFPDNLSEEVGCFITSHEVLGWDGSKKNSWMGRFPWFEMEYLLKHLFSPLLEDNMLLLLVWQGFKETVYPWVS